MLSFIRLRTWFRISKGFWKNLSSHLYLQTVNLRRYPVYSMLCLQNEIATWYTCIVYLGRGETHVTRHRKYVSCVLLSPYLFPVPISNIHKMLTKSKFCKKKWNSIHNVDDGIRKLECSYMLRRICIFGLNLYVTVLMQFWFACKKNQFSYPHALVSPYTFRSTRLGCIFSDWFVYLNKYKLKIHTRSVTEARKGGRRWQAR